MPGFESGHQGTFSFQSQEFSMTLDWEHFTPWSALGGGILLGIATALLLLLNGRVLGISGIVAGLLRPWRREAAWRVAFVLGLFAAPWVHRAWFASPDAEPITYLQNIPLLILAGLLVGYGTALGSGCTSGHGVCGLSRLSPRSLIATLTFMLAGFVTVYVIRHVLA
jgi:uncharacterized membrane protein YedE/YeeE